MRILITGGTGFLGGRIASFLEQEGHEIIKATRKQPAGQSAGTWVQVQWDDINSLQQACKNMDAVIHLAAMNATDCAKDPIAALEVNTVGTARLVQAASLSGVKRLVYFSTAHVYRSPLTGDINEQTLTTSLHPYATTHRAAEDVVKAAHVPGKMETIVVRLSNAFGAPVDKDADCWMLLVNDLCKQAVTQNRMELRSNGMQRRDFISLTDVCRAVSHLLTTEQTGTVLNVGGHWSPTVWEMTQLIANICKQELGFEPALKRVEPTPADRPEDLRYDIGRLLNTGFTLNSNIGDEIAALLVFCKNNFAAQ